MGSGHYFCLQNNSYQSAEYPAPSSALTIKHAKDHLGEPPGQKPEPQKPLAVGPLLQQPSVALLFSHEISNFFLFIALYLSFYGNYQRTAMFNLMCGQKMGVVDGTHQSRATEKAKFKLETMTDVCSVLGWNRKGS